MFTQADIDQLVSNIETHSRAEECTFANVCQVRETLHLQDQKESFYTEYPMIMCKDVSSMF